MKPSDIGLPYEDVSLNTADSVKIKAYVIPARRRPVQLSEWRVLSKQEQKARSVKEIDDWTREMGEDDAVEYAKNRPTIVIFHANAGQARGRLQEAR